MWILNNSKYSTHNSRISAALVYGVYWPQNDIPEVVCPND